MKIVNIVSLLLIVLGTAHSAFAETVTVYGVREQAAANCAAIGGYIGSCTVANWQTGYQVCSCHINESGIGSPGAPSCTSYTVSGIREQAYANCSLMGGQVTTCTVANWRTGYQICQCMVCR